MGKGEIIEHLGDALYSVRLKYHGQYRVDARISEYNSIINDLQNQIDNETDPVKRRTLRLEKTSFEKIVQWLQNKWPEEPEVSAWCADRTEDLTGEVAIMEIPGEAQYIHIRPGHQGGAVYSQERDGQLQPVLASGKATTFFNLMLLPGWQKWKPTYRRAIIFGMDYAQGTADIILDPAFSSQQNINVNQGQAFIDYMDDENYEYEISPTTTPEGFTVFCNNNPTHPT